MSESSSLACVDIAPKGQSRRQAHIRLIALAQKSEIDQFFAACPAPAYDIIRKAEAGRVMTRGRVGGSGQMFNAGEAAVSRCMIMCEGIEGISYRLGTDKDLAERSALIEALARHPNHAAAVEHLFFRPVATRLAAQDSARRQRVAASKVEFFTLVRGEDE